MLYRVQITTLEPKQVKTYGYVFDVDPNTGEPSIRKKGWSTTLDDCDLRDILHKMFLITSQRLNLSGQNLWCPHCGAPTAAYSEVIHSYQCAECSTVFDIVSPDPVM